MSSNTYLIIGGTGTLGKELIKRIYDANHGLDKIRVLSRGEHSQMAMQEVLTPVQKLSVHFIIGDVRDEKRMLEATRGVDYVFHLAAMKSVDKAEYDPWEAVQTNILGTKNVIDACKQNKVRKAIFTSTDKAVEPLNIYGASKLTAEKLWIQANIGTYDTEFSVCRYGNVLGSNGSVLKKWSELIRKGQSITITHPEMTRFFISPKNAASFVYTSLHISKGGEVFIPKMKSTNLTTLASEFKRYSSSNSGIEFTGLRPGEKLHEVLTSIDEVALTTDTGENLIRWPEMNLFKTNRRGTPVEKPLTSYTAERFTDDELYDLFTEYDKDLYKEWAL